MSEQQDSSVERLVRKSLITEDALGRPFSERIRQSRRTLENYLKAGGIPRWMERVMEVDARIAQEHQRLATAYRALQAECDGDPALFARALDRARGGAPATRSSMSSSASTTSGIRSSATSR